MPLEGRPSREWNNGTGASITAAAVIVRARMRGERVTVSAACCAVASKTAGYLGMSPTTSAGISVVGGAAASSATSMSMADSSASPSIGPCNTTA